MTKKDICVMIGTKSNFIEAEVESVVRLHPEHETYVVKGKTVNKSGRPLEITEVDVYHRATLSLLLINKVRPAFLGEGEPVEFRANFTISDDEKFSLENNITISRGGYVPH